MYEKYIKLALDRLFLENKYLGFWDEENNKIIESLYHDTHWNWKCVECKSYRYGLFSLSTILLAVEYNKLNISLYSIKIQRYLEWIYNNLRNFTISELTYGALLSLILGIKLNLIKEHSHSNVIEELLNKSLDVSISLNDNQNFLVLIPAYYYTEIFDDPSIKDKLILLTERILKSSDKHGLFQTGDIRYCHHQRLMYAIWGLIHSSYICYEDVIYHNIKKLLYYVWENRRQYNIDNAFIWHPKYYLVKNRMFLPIPILNMRSSKYLFECHQTFFANAINFFNKQFNEKFLIEERDKAIHWIFGENRLNIDLTQITYLDIPSRIMTTDKKLFVAEQNYKGSYEVGSYVLALSFY